MRVKMSKPPPPAPTASAIGPCPTVIKIVGRPGTGSLPSTIAPPDHPQHQKKKLPPFSYLSPFFYINIRQRRDSVLFPLFSLFSTLKEITS